MEIQHTKTYGMQQKAVPRGNHPHTNMISKPVFVTGGEYKSRIFEMHLKLRNQ